MKHIYTAAKEKMLVTFLILLLSLTSTVLAQFSGNPIVSGADPEIHYFNNKYYMYTTAWGGKQFHAFSSTDLTNWRDEGVIFDIGPQCSWAEVNGWAPGVAFRNNKYYFYYTAEVKIGVAVGNSPIGPFTDLGYPLIGTDPFTVDIIDAMVFIDDDQQAYIYYGGSNGSQMGVRKLNPDMISFATAPVNATPLHYTEGPYIVKRKGIYYLTYSNGAWYNETYNVRYATSNSPMGPWTYRGVILSSNLEDKGPGHHSVIKIGNCDEYYMVYHRYENGLGGERKVCIDRMYFNSADLIEPVNMTNYGVAPRIPDNSCPSINVVSGGIYKLTHKGTNQCLDVLYNSNQPGTNVQQYTDNGNDAQRWVITLEADGFYKLRHKGTTQCLDVVNGSSQPGANVQQYTDLGNDAQRWKLELMNDGYYKITHKGTNQCLDVVNNSNQPNANVQQYTDLNNDAQRWKLDLIEAPIVSGGLYKLTHKGTNQCLDVVNNSDQAGANVQQYTEGNTDAQRWYITLESDGFYKLKHKGTNQCLDVANNSNAPGTNVQQYTDLNNDAQRWKLEMMPDGYFKLTHKGTNQCLDVVNNLAEPGTNVIQYTDNGNDAQRWKLDLLPDVSPVNGTGNGLTGSYFNGMNFETPVLSRTDASLNMNWGTGSPGGTVSFDKFSTRWTGQIQPRYSGEYTFFITSDNGRRVWINNQLIVDKWVDDYDIEYSGKILLVAGKRYDIKVEYFENNGGANIKLEWASLFQNREPVPTAQLYSNPTPTVSISSPANNAIFNAPASISINANASDNIAVASVDFYNGKTKLGSDNTSPYSFAWTNVAAGSYSVTTIATDNSGAFTISTPINLTVSGVNVTVAAPSNLVAKTFSNAQINLTWKDNSSDETGFSIEVKKGVNGTYAVAGQVAAGVTSYNLTGLTPLSTYFIRVKAFNGTGISEFSNEAIAATTAASWSKATNPIWTTWGEGINDPTNVLQEYPRPQLVKENWQNLNGLWDVWQGTDINFSGAKKGILVPFPIQSALSGVKQNWHNFTYEKYIGIPQDWNGKRVILHFGAVDFQAEIFINGQSVLVHKGGYDPFNLDITDKVTAGNSYRLNVRVWDPHNTEGYPGPQGKQRDDRFNVAPFGIEYTPTGGIWQTVWMEAVPTVYISDIKMVPNIDNGTLQLTVTTTGASAGMTFEATAQDGSSVVNTVSGSANSTVTLSIPNAKLWSPDSPFLYALNITLKSGATSLEAVQSYFGMRKISLGKVNGITRMLLNNKFVFQMGPLDQGFWPDGIYTPPSEAAIVFDLQEMKKLGYNMVRKHIKVEPARWYYQADKLGLLVWQDMVNGLNETTAQRDQYKLELERMIRTHWNYPSIIMWVPFNEQWGLFDPVTISNYVQNLDPSRLVNENSACCAAPYSTVGHVKDYHYYSAPSCPSPDDNRALANGEFAGVVLRKPGNMWNDNAWSDWARVVATDNEFTGAVVDYCNILNDLRDFRGMSAAVFTQWTDVEAEINGNYTYDRKVFKGDAAKIKTALQSTSNNTAYINPPSGYSVFEAYNLPGHFMRHQNSRGRVDNVIAPLADAYWKIVPGLAGAGVSFQSLNFPGSYLRHLNGELVTSSNDGSQALKESATFYMRPGLANASLVSFESFNIPGRYIRHRNSLLYSEAVTDELGRNDATFFVYTGAVPNGNGDGLTANYFNGMNFETPVLSRKDTEVNFNWGTGSPASGVNVDAFSARWTGQILPKYSETYTFYITSDNGRRVWINDQLVVDKWIDDWGVEYKGTIALVAGQKVNIRVDYFENNGGADIKLEWSSASQLRQAVPQSQLFSNPLPTVQITAPTNGSTANAPANITISANASDNTSISKVEFYNGASKIGEDLTSPYSYAWSSVTAGAYSLTVRAYDNLQAVVTSTAVSVAVTGTQNQNPTVALTGPANNANYNAPATITISANANDADGSIAKVEFYNGSTKLGEDASSPYSFTWSNVAAGTYSISAKALDNLGASASSSAVTVTVKTVTTNPCDALPQYVENGGYVDGSKVKNGGSFYTCKPYPFTGWCNGASWAYAPGTGAYWQDAWTLSGTCTARSAEIAEEQWTVSIVPNPANDILNIVTPEPADISIFNAQGLEVLQTAITSNDNIRIADLSPGIYVVKITIHEKVITKVMIKE